MRKNRTHSPIRFPFWALILFGLQGFGQSEGVRLELGKSVERELRGGVAHSYSLPIPAGQFLHVRVVQRGIDVILTLVGPDGKTLAQVDSPNGTKGDEPIWYVTESPGNYRIEIGSLEAAASPGIYEIVVVELRPAVPDDRFYVDGRRLKADGDSLIAADDDESANRAFAKFEEAATSYRRINDFARRAAAIRELGNYGSNRNLETALGYFMEALALYESNGAKKETAETLLDIGLVYDDLQRVTEEVDAYHKALDVAVAINDRRLQVHAKTELGRAYAMLGDNEQALKFLSEALKLTDGTDWHYEISKALMGLGNVYQALGDFVHAIEFQQRNLTFLEFSGQKKGIPAQLLNIGNTYSGQGNYQQALNYYERALAAFEAGGGLVGMSYALNNVGEVHLAEGHYEDALRYFERARQLKSKFLLRDPVSLENIASVYRQQGKYSEALNYYRKSLDSGGGAGSLNGISAIYFLQGNYAKSLEFAKEAVALDERSPNPNAWKSLYSAAYALRALGRLSEARKALELAVSAIESLRARSPGGQTQSRAFEEMARPYQLLVDLSVSENLISDAFALAERIKARTLLDVLQTGRIDISKTMTAAERGQERALRNRIVSLNLQIAGETDKGRRDELTKELGKKRLEFEDLQLRINASHPELRLLRGEMRPIGLEVAGRLLPDAKSVFLEFVVSDERAFAFVITKDGAGTPALRVYSIEAGRRVLSAMTGNYRAAVASGDPDFQKQSRELYNLLMKPAVAQLAGKTNLIIVPDGPLWDLPFQALQDESNRYLIEQVAVSYAPSLTALNEMSKKAAAKRKGAELELVAFGNPTINKATSDKVQRVFAGATLEPLPESERLVVELGKMYGPVRSRIYTGDRANEETAKSESPRFRIVQFATHGILNGVSPMYSYLVLAQNGSSTAEDGLIEAWEMKELNLRADVVILSACETARGRISNGEGVIGMTWALFIAGTPTTVASQWKVEPSSTTELMLEFHRQILSRRPPTKAEALRRSSLRVMRNPRYRHPLFWAGFVIVGDAS